LLAAATLDRLRHNAHRVILDGMSYRGKSDTNNMNKKDKKIALEK